MKKNKKKHGKPIRRNRKNAPPQSKINKNLLWICSAAVVAIAVVTVAIVLFAGRSGNDRTVAYVNGRTLGFNAVRNEMSTAESNLMWEYFDMFPDEWDLDHDRQFRGGQTFGEAVRAEAVRLAAVNSLIGEYAESLGIALPSVTIQMIDDEIDNFIEHWGQHEFDDFLIMGGYADRGHLESAFAAQELMILIVDAVKSDPAEFARFEPYMQSAEEITGKANEILARARGGEDFDMLIAVYGEDPGMARNPDGYTFTSGQMVMEFEQATRELEIGEISGLVRSDFGYHIIKRVEPNPDEMWGEPDDYLGAKHILIAIPSPEEKLENAINLVFAAKVNEAEIQLLPALDGIPIW